MVNPWKLEARGRFESKSEDLPSIFLAYNIITVSSLLSLLLLLEDHNTIVVGITLTYGLSTFHH